MFLKYLCAKECEMVIDLIVCKLIDYHTIFNNVNRSGRTGLDFRQRCGRLARRWFFIGGGIDYAPSALSDNQLSRVIT